MFARSPRGAHLGLRPYGVAVVATILATGLTAACHELGLGEAIAKDIVEHHGGTISAHSDGQGRGASFTIVLPVA